MDLTAEPFNAQRTLQCNMVSRVMPRDKLMEVAELLGNFAAKTDKDRLGKNRTDL